MSCLINRRIYSAFTFTLLHVDVLQLLIEWSYKDTGHFFPLLNYDKVLKMRAIPVAKMYHACMILKIALTAYTIIKPHNFFI